MTIDKEAYKKILLQSITDEWISSSNLSRKSKVAYYITLELLEVLFKEDKIEKLIMGPYTYWRLIK